MPVCNITENWGRNVSSWEDKCTVIRVCSEKRWRKKAGRLLPCPETVRDIKQSHCITLKLHFSIRSHRTPLQWDIITDFKKNQVIYSGYYRLTCNRHHPTGCKGSEDNYSLTGQDLFEGFKVCGSLLSNRAAWATPAHTGACRKAKGDFWDSGCLRILTLGSNQIRSLSGSSEPADMAFAIHI